MKSASLVIIGTELTRGIIEDKHTSFVAKELENIGIELKYSIIIPDDGSIENVLSFLLNKVDVIITTGGLGPTTDDKTRSSISNISKRKLIKDRVSWEKLLSTLGHNAYGANERQCYIPEGFTIIKNNNGTAPGFYGNVEKTLLISLPGPPKEMRVMFYDDVVSILSSKEKVEIDEYSSFLTREAKLEELYCDINPHLKWGTRFQDDKISLYLSGGDKSIRDMALKKLQEKCGMERIVVGNETPLSILVKTLKEKGLKISSAESCTGGMAGEKITSTPGSSEYYLGGVISYNESVKEGILGVKEETVKDVGVVSSKCALEMAEGVLEKTSSDFSFSITGVAGPDKSEGKEVGTVYFGFSGKNRKSEVCLLNFPPLSSRNTIRNKSTNAAFILMNAYIENKDVNSIVDSWKDTL